MAIQQNQTHTAGNKELNETSLFYITSISQVNKLLYVCKDVRGRERVTSMPTYEHDGTMARFADQAAGLSITDLLSNNKGTFHVKVSPNAQGEIFLFASKSYKTQLTISNGEVVFCRNDYVARKKVGPVQRHYQILVSWRPDKFQLALMIDDDVGDDDAVVTVETRPIYIPIDAISWARRYSLLHRSTFSSPEDFLRVVVESIQQVNRTIRKGNSIKLFWDRQRSKSSTAPKLVPKREREAMDGIAAFIQDKSLLAGYELIRESAASSGSVDLLAIGPIESGGTTTICIEGKKAHSGDLYHGITDQLPEYMDASRASYGIYLVLWYRCDEFERPFEDSGDITWGLTMKRPWENIVIEKFDLSLPKSPSDKSFKYGGKNPGKNPGPHLNYYFNFARGSAKIKRTIWESCYNGVYHKPTKKQEVPRW